MPRTKQIHPRNLRDKIEEAQKELNGAEVSKKEILEAGIKGTSESLKGVKRKKIVAENHLKKIPKSPLRNPLQAKHKQNTEEASFTLLQSAPEPHKKRSHLSGKSGKQCPKQNGEAPGVHAEATKSNASVSPKKPLLVQHPAELRRWKSEGSNPARLGVPDGKGHSSAARTDSSECLAPRSRTPSPPYTTTAFDVLLKAMEPELSSLSQKGSSCAMKAEKVKPNKTARSPSRFKNSSLDAPNQTSQDLMAESQPSPGTSYAAQVSAAQQKEEVAVQSVSRSYSPHEHFVTKSSQHYQQHPRCLSFTASQTTLQNQENAKLEQVYNSTVTSSVGLPPPASRTQVPLQNQHLNSSLPLSTSPAAATQSPPMPVYNSVVNQSVEQMCNLLKDPKPKKQGKYICEYCSRACAKPSVLLKHIRSHTGERPYPCVTCGFSFKTKSNLYKHKKSHAHTIKLGLVLQPDASGLFLSQESPKALSIHSDVEDSGESEEEAATEERRHEPSAMELQLVKRVSSSEALPMSSSIPGCADHVANDFSPQDRSSESQAMTELPKVVVHPITMSPARTDSPKVVPLKPEPGSSAQKQKDLQAPHSGLFEKDEKACRKGGAGQPEGRQDSPVGTAHAQLQRQQATDCSQEQQGKLLLSPRSLGSTDSGYFSRSESADQTVSPPTPFARLFPTLEQDSTKTAGPPGSCSGAPAPSALLPGEKAQLLPGQMRPPLATKTLEERISKLISDNEALVDNKQLDSVKPRRTSLSRRGSIDSPKSYIFKDSFQFDLKPMGRRTSSSSDIPKSPFTPTEKSKQVFLLSVPSLDCLPITRSNSMPTTGYSAVPASIIPPPHPLRGSQSFDDKIGALYDDVFVSGPNTLVPVSGHPRTLVRQAAVEDSSAGDGQALGPGQSLDEGFQAASEGGAAPRSKAPAPGSHSEKKKSHQGRGTMFECETCRNRYRKLENFENHKKFYCSELHGPKTKVALREPEQSPVASSTQPQMLHYRVASSTGVWEQTPQVRKRRKMKSVGDDDELQQNDSGAAGQTCEGPAFPSVLGSTPGASQHCTALAREPQHRNARVQSPQIQLLARGPEQSPDAKLSSSTEQQGGLAVADKGELARVGSGISVIQHTNSLSRPGSFDKLEPFEGSPAVPLQELGTRKVLPVSQEEVLPSCDPPRPLQPAPAGSVKGELQEGPRKLCSERHVLGQPSRLVRQHKIQVPEILVTEEPDRDLEAQSHDAERSDKFSWPQRSETLSKLPTEKLPPKKKRLRLAEVEHSSTESSLDSTLSRSLSRESSLSHTSSFSASFDIEDISKAEAPPKIEFLNKAEFLVIPPGSNTLSVPGGHREMRRAASEQISCVQTSMEVSEFRSKSFDCGSVTPPQTAALAEPQPSSSPASSAAVSGYVPLLERRRGPLIRQISLNVPPDSQLPPANPASFQNTALPGVSVSAVPPQGPALPETPFPESPALHSQTQGRDLQPEVPKSSSASILPIQQLFGISVLSQINAPSSQRSTQVFLQVSAQGDRAGSASAESLKSEDCFAPKYQLHCQVLASNKPSSSNPVHPLPNQGLSDPVGTDGGAASAVFPTKLVDPASSASPPPPSELGPASSQASKVPSPLVLAAPLHRSVPAYCFAAVTSLPQILVTQDLSVQPICQVNHGAVPIGKELTAMPNSQNDQNALPNLKKELVGESVFSEISQGPVLESLPVTQKMSVGRLSPQQESSASSKRMLSPANSLDIAMEKHQKRAKEENGAICGPEVGPLAPLGGRASEVSKHKKPVLVRQVCTTEPLDGAMSEPGLFPPPEGAGDSGHLTGVSPADNSSSGYLKLVIAEPVTERLEPENPQVAASSAPAPGKLPAPLEGARVPPPQAADGDQEGSPGTQPDGGQRISQAPRQLPRATAPPSCDTGDAQPLAFPSLKTATSFTWCYLSRRKSLPLPQQDQKMSAYSDWTVSSSNPNPLGLPTKVALSLLNSKQKTAKSLYCQAITTHSKSDLLVYSSKWKSNLSKRALGNQKSTLVEFSNKDASEINSEQDKENSLIKSEPRRIKIFDGGYKSNEEYVYVRGRGRGKYICEECGIRCKKPSMLKKHIRTHTDVRPYHCTYCNFSFKTKGNLTKHMKSKAHSKKCVDLGVSGGLLEEQDTEESDEKQRFSCERSGYDLEESDGPDEEDNENEDDDEDSQAESVLSAAPSVTASPQHLPSRGGPQDLASADEDSRTPDCSPGAHADPMDILPRALLTKMTVLSAVHSSCSTKPDSLALAKPQAAENQGGATAGEACRSPQAAPRSPCHQMSVDYLEAGKLDLRWVSLVLQEATSSVGPLCRAQHNPLPAAGSPSGPSPHPEAQEQKQQTGPHLAAGTPSPQTHLFSHLPLHSQQQARTPYNMVPIGGIHVVPAGLAYSTFVPLQAGSVQLTIPAVSVFHRTTGAPGDPATQVAGAANATGGLAELSSLLPCFPVGQIRVPGLQSLSPPGLQPLPSLSMETLNIVGLAGPHMGQQVQPPGLALNAVGLQVLSAKPSSQSSTAPPAPLPGLQILNIALPTLIPSASQVPVDTQGAPEGLASQSHTRDTQPKQTCVANANQASRTESPQGSPRVQRGQTTKIPDPPGPAGAPARPAGSTDANHVKAEPEPRCGRALPPSPSPSPSPAEPAPQPPCGRALRAPGPPRRQHPVPLSDLSSDDDEDRLVIAT
ncbi:zinc finger protein 40 [Ochotona princeps]|uniref:zinc finger protein 40 n=1 Tax=Ochotona princeps TaxID=9978 RepID=UPI002714FA5F|nr:zinc finger protein 40 [Ochotona princeps]